MCQLRVADIVALNIGSSLSGGIGRIANRNGAKIAVAYMVLGLVWQVTVYSAVVAWLRRMNGPVADVALLSLEAPFAVSAGVAVGSLVLIQYLTIVAVRTFVSGHSRSIPSAYFTRNIAFVVGNTILGGIAFSLLVLAGTMLLIVPGVVAYIAFIFFVVFLSVEDENFVTALRDSWTLTRGHWLRLIVVFAVLMFGVGIISAFVSVLATAIAGAVGGQALGTLVGGVIGLPLTVLTLGVLAEVFNQLQDSDPTSRANSR